MRRFVVRVFSKSKAIVFALSILALGFSSTPVAAAGETGSVGSWTTSSNHAPLDLSGGAAVVSNGYVYVIGGSSSSGGTWLDSVYYAKLASDGSVGSWTTSNNPIPHGVYYPSAASANGYIYVMGGYGGGFQSAVYYAKVNSDGSIGSWATSPNSLPQAAYEASVITRNGYIYFMGGVNDEGTRLNTVYYAKINSNGSIGSWATNTANLPQGVESPAATIVNDRVYVMGGSSGSSYKNTIFYADFNDDGSIGSWTTDAATLPQALNGAVATGANGYIYLAGGNTDSDTTKDSAYYAKVNDDGSVGSWTAAPSLPQPLQYSASVFNNGYWYVLVGQNDGSTQNTVYYAKLNFTSQQSVANTPSGQAITIATPAGTNITSLDQVTAPASDDGYSYPLGLMNFTFTTNNVENQVTLTFQTDLKPNQVVARKYNPTTKVFSDIPGAVITETSLNGKHALNVTYSITDGGPLDEDGVLNGVIVDPVGLAQINSTSVTAPSTGHGSPASKDPLIIVSISAGAFIIGSAMLLTARHRASSSGRSS